MKVSAKLFLSDQKWIKPVLVLLFIILTCPNVQGCDKTTNTGKGANIPMKTYYIGRFSIAVPAEMHEEEGSRSHHLRRVEIDEIEWPEGINHEKAREVEWNNFTAEIKKLTPLEGKLTVIIKTQDFPDVGKWASGIFYHNLNDGNEEGTWKVLVDSGQTAVWFTGIPVLVEKENKSSLMINNIKNIGNSYHALNSATKKPKGDWFYLKHGAVNLPYLWQEKSYVRFEGHPLDLKIELEMHETYTVEKEGLIEKTIDAIATGYASGVKIKKIRSHKRTVADLNGEEEVLRMTEKGKSSLDFVWEYNGKENSGEYPRIVISMESPDGNLDEKLKIWDAVLDSMKPMFERKK
jgi:hypothetical protein